MNAVYQARIAVMFGAGLMVIGLLKAVFGSGEGAAPFLSAGVFIAFFAGGLRLWMRQKWLEQPEENESIALARRRAMAGPFGPIWAFWLGVSRDGT